MATAFGVDVKVLEHLRGYPEELRRYSNLMKQSHPRGPSSTARSRPTFAPGRRQVDRE